MVFVGVLVDESSVFVPGLEGHKDTLQARWQVIKEVPKIQMEYRERTDVTAAKTLVARRPIINRIVEVPQVHLQERLVEVPKIEVQEVVRHIPKLEVRTVDRVVEVPQVQYVEKLVEVPKVEIQDCGKTRARSGCTMCPSGPPHVLTGKKREGDQLYVEF
eukprot:Skav208192  [mRNA]  locus=scaffold2530:535883:540947:- [translate_table: standard]